MKFVNGLRRSERIQNQLLRNQTKQKEYLPDTMKNYIKNVKEIEKKITRLNRIQEQFKIAAKRAVELRKKISAARTKSFKHHRDLIRMCHRNHPITIDISRIRQSIRFQTALQARIQNERNTSEGIIAHLKDRSEKYFQKCAKIENFVKSGQENGELSTKTPWMCCEMCEREYKDEEGRVPRILECGHSFCETCISNWFVDIFCQCPTDFFYSTRNCNAGATADEKAKQFPKNFEIIERLSSMK